jgi:hypothetical protein
MKKLTMKQEKVNKKIATPVGRLMWMHLANPTPANAVMQANKYTCTVAWDAHDKTQAGAIKALTDAVLDVARRAYGDNTITLQDLKENNVLSVIKDGGKMQDYLQGLCVTGASTSADYPPKVYGPIMAQGEMNKADISRIKNGDYGRMVITISSYKTPAKHGITAYLSLVQFAKTGEYLGGASDGKTLLSDLDVEAVTDDEKALLESLPLQDDKPAPVVPDAPAKKPISLHADAELKEKLAADEITEKEIERENKYKEEEPAPAEDNSFDDLFNF